MRQWIRPIVCALAIAVLTGAGITPVRKVAAATSALTDLRSVDELRDLFNKDSGQVRIVLLVSPT